jgi:ribosome recycling factor
MAYDFSSFDGRASGIVDWLQKEFTAVRTGRATPALLDGVQVESYGARVPITQVGTVGVEDPRTIRISIWDKGQLKSVEKAITEADLGLSVVADDKGLRVIFPELTGERREQLLKVAKAKLEEARVSLRNARDEANKKMEAADLSDDEKKRMKEELQKRVDAKNAELLGLYEDKESEIRL